MTRWILFHCLLLLVPQAGACDLDDARLVRDENRAVYYRIEPVPLESGRHFTMRFQFCREGRALELKRFKLDASMPAHGHGMNYRASSRRTGAGAYSVEGMLFHMPGQWRISVEYAYADNRRQLDIEIEL